MQKRYKKKYIAVLAAILLLSLPLWVGNYWSHILGDVGLYIILGIGLNVVVGLAGLLDLGYVAFFGIGAYSYALLASPQFGLHMPFWVLLPFCILLALIAGALLGLPVLRMRGDYFAIVTLGFGEIIRILLNNLDPITNGPRGLLRIDPPRFFGITVDEPVEWYYLILCGVGLSLFFYTRIMDCRIGRAWMAMREDQVAAELVGIDLLKYKLLAFAIGASFGGLGGVIFAARQGSIFPENFSLIVSINVLCIIILGGMGSIRGVVLGSFVLVGLPELLREFEQYRMLVFGLLLVVTMIFRPMGFFRPEKAFGISHGRDIADR